MAGGAVNSVKVLKVTMLLEDRLLIKPDEGVNKTPGGLIIPDTLVEKPRKGTVIAIGPGKQRQMVGYVGGERQQMTVKVGDRVLYTAHSGQFGGGGGYVEIEGYAEPLLLMYEAEVIAVIDM